MASGNLEFLRGYPVRIVTAQPKGRIIALSDIHACDELFEKVIRKVGLTDSDTLVIIGDLIERGPHSLRALRRAMALAERENTFVLIGNMDAHKHWEITGDLPEQDEGLLYNRRYYGSSLFYDMCLELSLPCETVRDVRAAKPAVREAFRKELDFIKGLPTILDTPAWRFVHGGLPANDLSEVLKGLNPCLKYDRAIDHMPRMDKPLVVGHSPTNQYWTGPERVDPYWCEEKQVLSIDGGCGLRADAQLNAVILYPDRPGVFETVSADPYLRAEALDAQEGRAASIRLSWPNNEAAILSETPLSYQIRYLRTGAVVDIPRRYLDELKEDGVWWINDISDTHLSVQPGDTLTLLAQTEKGWYVSLNNLRGWYFGRIGAPYFED